jgi:hypothetical protein
MVALNISIPKSLIRLIEKKVTTKDKNEILGKKCA